MFGVFKRGGGRVYTEVVEDASKRSLLRVIRGQVALRTVTHSDGWRGYDGLVDVGYKRHLRVHHGKDPFAAGKSHMNGIESVRGYAKRRLAKFNGTHEQTFYFHLKETESGSTTGGTTYTRCC